MCMHMYPHVHTHAHVTCITVANVAILGGEAARDGEIESKSDTQKNSRPSWGHTQEGVPSATGGCAERPVTSKNIVAARRGRSNCYGRYCGPFCEESSNSADTQCSGDNQRRSTRHGIVSPRPSPSAPSPRAGGEVMVCPIGGGEAAQGHHTLPPRLSCASGRA